MKHFVYRHYDEDGKLLYVGCTNNLHRRTATHKTSSPWFHRVTRITNKVYPDRNSALLAESNAVRRFNPVCNAYTFQIEHFQDFLWGIRIREMKLCDIRRLMKIGKKRLLEIKKDKSTLSKLSNKYKVSYSIIRLVKESEMS